MSLERERPAALTTDLYYPKRTVSSSSLNTPRLAGKRPTGRRKTPEELAILAQCVEDGWPLVQIERTYGVGHRTMLKYFPDYHGLKFNEAGSLGMAAKKASRKIR